MVHARRRRGVYSRSQWNISIAWNYSKVLRVIATAMPLRSEASSSRDTLNTATTTDERSQTGRYVAGGAMLAITLLAVHRVLLQNASTIAGVCIPVIIMLSYIIWILYSAHRDRRKASRLATAMQLAEVVSVPARPDDATSMDDVIAADPRKSCPKLAYDAQKSCVNPVFSSRDEIA